VRPGCEGYNGSGWVEAGSGVLLLLRRSRAEVVIGVKRGGARLALAGDLKEAHSLLPDSPTTRKKRETQTFPPIQKHSIFRSGGNGDWHPEIFTQFAAVGE